jgi:tRNA(Arg) A34 adenosine deaminase TadA
MNANEGGPFGCLVVKDGEIVAEGNNMVFSTNDPTAHAEIVAIRRACIALDSFQLEDCLIYCSCEPCPMCLGAIYWTRPKAVYFACTHNDAAEIEFDDALIYDELVKPVTERIIPFKQILRDEGLQVFRDWEKKEDKVQY